MVTIYQDYNDEPKDSFRLLPEKLACQFYALEMDSYRADTDFFESFLSRQGSFLEIGCGTGRITHRIAGREGSNRFVIGIDISIPMLQLARQRQYPLQHSPHYVCMDMVKLGFSTKFDAVLIAYNTLNLLHSEDEILACLRGCKKFLQPRGRLLVQLYIPTEEFIRRKKTFQFQIFDRPGNGKIIKEILKKYHPHSQSIDIEERFRVRPMQKHLTNEDWHRSYTIAGFSADQWRSLFHKAGFTPTHLYGDYAGNNYHQSTSSTLLAVLTLQYGKKRLRS